ncbi:MAG: leucine-rich repeat domain-containing protein [Prevotellamassilia sp.]
MSVTTIEIDAFRDCSGLTEINIPNSVTTIGSCAFAGCSGLNTINIPNSVTTIESNAFNDCSGLTSINIPNSVTFIGSSAFYGCSGLKTLYFHSINPPTIHQNYFGYDFHPQTFYVPQEAVATYQATVPYNQYDIRGMDEPAGIGEVETTEAPQSGNIYDLNGRLVRTDGNLQALPKGIYILNVKKMVR